MSMGNMEIELVYVILHLLHFCEFICFCFYFCFSSCFALNLSPLWFVSNYLVLNFCKAWKKMVILHLICSLDFGFIFALK